MNPPIVNVQKLCYSLAELHGDLALAALFKRESDREQWDFVIAATWLTGSLSDYELIARELKRQLSAEEVACIARIVVLPSGKPAWMRFEGGTGTPSVPGIMRNFTFNGEPIAVGHIVAPLDAQGAMRREKRRRAVKSA